MLPLIIVIMKLVIICRGAIHYKCGFISIEHGEESLPQFVICMKTLSNSAMKPSLFKCHLETNHVKEKEQDESYFQLLGEIAKRQRLDETGVIYEKEGCCQSIV